MSRLLWVLCVAALLPGPSALAPAASGSQTGGGPQRLTSDWRLDELERALTSNPSSLRIGAEYRQLVIATGRYDRSLKLFERLAKDPHGGANRFVNLALAYVDKVPVSGSIRQALLGRDAMDAATRAIAIEPGNIIAYFIRGLVNLYYDRAIFHRTDKGVADLEEARRLANLHPEQPASRVFVALGDGYWRLNHPEKARQTWKEGAARFPDSEALRVRLAARDNEVLGIVEHALSADVRVDTTLRELFPDVSFDHVVTRSPGAPIADPIADYRLPDCRSCCLT